MNKKSDIGLIVGAVIMSPLLLLVGITKGIEWVNAKAVSAKRGGKNIQSVGWYSIYFFIGTLILLSIVYGSRD